jgi:hypothetical protein
MTERDLTYREPDYDDTCCVFCGTLLPAKPSPLTWEDHGFCGLRCARLYAGGVWLQGRVARDLAELAEVLGGPGFTAGEVSEWLSGARPNAPAYLVREHGNDVADGPDWHWRLRSGGKTHAERITRKPERL